jgi:YD repeat-containing protein
MRIRRQQWIFAGAAAVVAALAVLVFALPGHSALADTPAPFLAWSNGCPNPSATIAPFNYKGFSSCEAALSAATSALAACEGVMFGTCPGNGGGTNIDCCAGANSQHGSMTIGAVYSYCPGGSVYWYYDAYNMGFCTEGLLPPKNLGLPDCSIGKCEGNPVNPGALGNKLEVEVDYVGSGPFPLRFTRYYNALEFGYGEVGARLGRRWSQTYGRRLHIPPVNPVRWVLAIREDAKVLTYDGAYAFVDDPTVSETLQPAGSGWKLTNRQDETELYDSAGRLTSITNRAGLTQTLAYDPTGRLTTVTDPFGRSLAFTYDGTNRIQSMATPAGTHQYAYGSWSDALISVTYPDTRTRTYLYRGPECFEPVQGLLEGIVDENGERFATFTYLCGGLAVSTEHAGGAGKVTFEYPTNGRVTVTPYVSATQALTRTYNYASVNGLNVHVNVQGEPCPSCGNPTRTYDSSANPASTTDWNGNRTDYTHDLRRRLETSRTEGLTSTGGTTPQTRTITTEWHSAFRIVKRKAEPLRITTYTYNGDGGASCGFKADGATPVPGMLCSKSVQATTDANGAAAFGATPSGAPRVWTYTYNANGSVLTVDGPRTDVADTTTYTYYANDDAEPGKRGNVATITNAAGHTTSITAYTANGRPLTTVDANGLTTTLAYDARERLTSRSVGGETTAYDYDAVGQLKKVTLPDNSFLAYTYDAAHRLTGIQDNLGNRIAYTLDLAGNRTSEEVFDPTNTLPAQSRSRVYSSLNRLFREISGSGNATEYAYDDQGNVTSVKAPAPLNQNYLTVNQYDPLNRLKQVTDPNLGVTQYGYNGLDALTQVSDPRTLVTGYAVDGLGNLNQQTSPDTGITVNTYDVAGNLLTQTDAKLQVTAYTYDALNRVTQITFHDGAKQVYAYDQGPSGLGRLSSITERSSTNDVTSVVAYAYEQHGRVTSETRTVGGQQYVLGYSYDSAGRLSGLSYPSGRTVTYGFDALGRVNQVTTTKGGESKTVARNVTYWPFGGVSGFTLGNDQSYVRGYDIDGRVASYSLGGQIFALTYDVASRIETITDLATPANHNNYGYDSLDRLTAATVPGTSFNYVYDAVGNRTSQTAGTGPNTYTYSPDSNRLASITSQSSPTRSFAFDANGSTVNDGLNSYVYDTRGRMVQATSVLGPTTYQVNALGQRIRKTNSITDTVFHYDTRGKLIAESDPGGGVKREILYLGDIPVGVIQ